MNDQVNHSEEIQDDLTVPELNPPAGDEVGSAGPTPSAASLSASSVRHSHACHWACRVVASPSSLATSRMWQPSSKKYSDCSLAFLTSARITSSPVA